VDILLATTGSAGDVYPFLALGRALRARGHRAVLLAPLEFEPLTRRLGLDFTPLEPEECDSSQAAPSVNKSLLSRLGRSAVHPLLSRWRKLARASTVVPLLRPAYQAIAQHVRPGRTVVVVATAPVLGARIAHDYLGVPLVTVHLSPVSLRSAFVAPCQPPVRLPTWLSPALKRVSYRLLDSLILDPLLAGSVNRLRAELGLSGVQRILHEWRHSPQRVIGLFPSWFAPPQPDWPKVARLTGFLFDERANLTDLSPEIELFLRSGPAPIVVTPGSAIRSAYRFFAESIRACVQLKRRALLLTPHRDQIPDTLPEGVRHFEYAPFNRIFARASALIHTGGIGTAAQALSAGIPQIVMPLKNDQPDNACRLERLGVARWFHRNWFRASRVSKALTELLSSDEVTQRLRLYADHLRDHSPLADTCRLIEEMVPVSLSQARVA